MAANRASDSHKIQTLSSLYTFGTKLLLCQNHLEFELLHLYMAAAASRFAKHAHPS